MQAEIEKILALVDEIVAKRGGLATGAGSLGGGAIQHELDRPAEVTATVSLRNSQVVKEFEQRAADARIRADSVRAGLLILHEVLSRAFLAM